MYLSHGEKELETARVESILFAVTRDEQDSAA